MLVLGVLTLAGCGRTVDAYRFIVPDDFEGGIIVIEDKSAGTDEMKAKTVYLTVPDDGVVRVATMPKFDGVAKVVANRVNGDPLIVTGMPYDDFRDGVGFRICVIECVAGGKCSMQLYVGTATGLEQFDFYRHFEKDLQSQ